jgi:hypothetical protein
MEDYRNFLIDMFKQLSTGDFTVTVDCANGKEFAADVIGYSEEYMTVEVRFHSDELQKPGRKEVPYIGFGYGTSEETVMVDCMVPVKVEKIWWESIKLK